MGQLTTPLVAANRALKTDSFFLRPFCFDGNNINVGVGVGVGVGNEFNWKARRVETETSKSEKKTLECPVFVADCCQ